MTEYALYNSNNNSINKKLGNTIPQKLTIPNGDVAFSPSLGYTNNQYILVILVDDTSAKPNNLYEWSGWNPIVYDAGTFTVTRTGVYTQKADNASTRNIYERLVMEEFDRRMGFKVSVEVSVGRTVEIKFNEPREITNLISFGMSAQMHVQAGTTDTYTLRDISDTDQTLDQDEMVAFFQGYANKRNNKLIDAHALIDNVSIQYDYDDGSHW